jgi:serine/threonine-protein kinase RsbW
VSLAQGAVGSPRTEDFVEVRLPADGAYLSVLRTATAGLAARLDFTIDEIEDLRIAVDEACAMLLAQAVADTELYCRFTLEPPTLIVEVTAATREGRIPARDTFAWTVLSALAGEVTATVDSDQHLTITLRKTAEGAAA